MPPMPQCLSFFVFLLSAVALLSETTPANTTPPPSPVKLIFIHHSTGGNWLADANAEQPYGGLGNALMDNNYFVSATNYGWGSTQVGDRTDIPNWPEWFLGAFRDTILTELYGETGQNIGDFGDWPRLAVDPGGENTVILFKSCFPNSDLFGDPTDPPAASINEQYTVANAKAVYTNLLSYFATRTDKLFILITPPPMNENEYQNDYQPAAHRAANARAVNNWLVNQWLEDYPYHNVAVFDYFNVLTGAEHHHHVVENTIEHVIPTQNNFAFYPNGEWDSHPNTEGQQKATAEFVPFINYSYQKWRGSTEDALQPPLDLSEPTVEIQVNATDTGVSINTSDSATLSLALNTGGLDASPADWWLLQGTPQGEWRTFNLNTFTFTADTFAPLLMTDLMSFPPLTVTSLTGLETGTHLFCFGVDTVMNGALDFSALYYDCASVTVVAEVTGEAGEAQATHRLAPEDFKYLGAFRLPEAFNWGALGLSYYPLGNHEQGSLLVTGFQSLRNASQEICDEASSDCLGYFAEIAIPIPDTASNWEDLPIADFIREMTPFDGGLVQTVNKPNTFISDIQYVPRQGSQTTDKLYGSLNAWYPEGDFGEETFPTIWFNELDGSNARGMFYVGPSSAPYHGRKMGAYLFTVPDWYADQYLGGRILVTGRSRGTPIGDEAVTSAGGSQGPTLFAITPWNTETPSGNLEALPVLYYRNKYPGCAGPDIGVGRGTTDCDYPGFSMCDAWTGGAFVEKDDKSAIILLGLKGSTNCYYCADPIDDSECNATPLPGECDYHCNESRGYHCGPYERQVIFYDTMELGQSAQGGRDPFSILPYTVWRPDPFYLGDADGHTCGDVGGMAVDRVNQRVFMVERGLGGFENENAAVIHLWSIK